MYLSDRELNSELTPPWGGARARVAVRAPESYVVSPLSVTSCPRVFLLSIAANTATGLLVLRDQARAFVGSPVCSKSIMTLVRVNKELRARGVASIELSSTRYFTRFFTFADTQSFARVR